MRDHLFILDLNGTLLETRREPIPYVIHNGMARVKYIYHRPYLMEFMEFLLNNFHVGIWTSNIAENAMAIVKSVFTDEQLKRLKFVCAREQCTLLKSDDPRSIKDLDKIWERLPHFKGHTTIIDNEREKLYPHHLNCLMQVSEYDPSEAPQDHTLKTMEDQIRSMFNIYNM